MLSICCKKTDGGHIARSRTVFATHFPFSVRTYKPNCDIDGDSDIDIFEIVIATGNQEKAGSLSLALICARTSTSGKPTSYASILCLGSRALGSRMTSMNLLRRLWSFWILSRELHRTSTILSSLPPRFSKPGRNLFSSNLSTSQTKRAEFALISSA